jgi:hypothetical protein
MHMSALTGGSVLSTSVGATLPPGQFSDRFPGSIGEFRAAPLVCRREIATSIASTSENPRFSSTLGIWIVMTSKTSVPGRTSRLRQGAEQE